tara:strand:+ start:1501 stop:1704 length:204 start_codon:yes stop_codon:yes gene_type:complete
MLVQFTMICLDEAIKLSGLDIVNDHKFEKRIRHHYDDEVPISWYPMFRHDINYYEKDWIMSILKNYF